VAPSEQVTGRKNDEQERQESDRGTTQNKSHRGVLDTSYTKFFGKTLTSKHVQQQGHRTQRVESDADSQAAVVGGRSGQDARKDEPTVKGQYKLEQHYHEPGSARRRASSQDPNIQQDRVKQVTIEQVEDINPDIGKRETAHQAAQRIKNIDQRDAEEAAALIVAGSAGADPSVQAAQRDKEVVLKSRLKTLVASSSFEGRASTDFYGFGKVLGQGSFGKVRLAWQRLAGNKVAIKSYEKSKMTEPQHWKRVQQEIKLMERLNHPHVIQMLEMI
jgi:hypothetical protein